MSDDTKVVPIGSGKKKRSNSRSDNEKMPSDSLVAQRLARHMITGDMYPAPLDSKLVVSCPVPGEYLYYHVVDPSRNVVRRVTKEFINDLIFKFCSDYSGLYPELLVKPSTVDAVYRRWRSLVPKIDGLVKPFEFADGNSPVIHRCNFVPDLDRNFDGSIDPERWPVMEFFNRCSTPLEMAAYIGSLFYIDSYLQQYLYLYGEGAAGKSTILRLIHSVLNSACHFDNFANKDNQFWTSSFVGKRVVIFPDSNHNRDMQCGIFKQLTGGDPVRIEFKNGATFTTILNCKYIITSNYEPVFKFDRADQRRAVVVHVAPIQGKIDPAIESRMHADDQLQFLVEYCCWAYRKLCVTQSQHLPLCLDLSQQQELVHNADEELEQELAARFAFSPEFAISSKNLQDCLGLKHTDKNGLGRIARVLKNRFGCVRVRYFGDDRLRKVAYVGIQMRPNGLSGLGDNSDWVTNENEKIYRALQNNPSYQKAVEAARMTQSMAMSDSVVS